MTRRGLRFALFAGVLAGLSFPGSAVAETLTLTADGNGTVTGTYGFLGSGSLECGPSETCVFDIPRTCPLLSVCPPTPLQPQTVELTAAPASGWNFSIWYPGACAFDESLNCTITMDVDRSAEANFFDAVSPTVDLTAPAESATLSGDVHVSATASDDQTGIDFVQFRLVRVGGQHVAFIGNDSVAPFEMDWHSRNAENGVYAIQARAVDNGGRERIDAVGVVIANPIGVRYAAPSANGPDPCVASSPCSLKHAVEHAISGEEVVIAPGDYLLGDEYIDLQRNVAVHGIEGQPRPRVFFNMANLQLSGGSLRHLYVEGASTPLGADARSSQVVVVSDVFAVSSGQFDSAIFLGGDVVLRDSVAHATGTGAQALSINGGRNTDGTTELRNVTAWATGPMSTAIYVTGSCEEDSQDPSLCDDIWRPVVTAKNVVARGGLYDLTTYTNDLRAPATLNVSHSNYRPGTIDSSPYTVVNDQGNNQSAEPQFANAAAGDFHQLPGSPTIDAGTADPQNGAVDIDGNPRVFGSAPDIGADEFFVAAPPPPSGSGSATCTIEGTDANDRITGTRGNDIICARKGNDIVNGGGGNDIIRLGPGNDKGYGQGGRDRIFGDAGRDRLVGGPGRDRLDGGRGRDICIGRGDVKRRCP